jgi:hypothetical protein
MSFTFDGSGNAVLASGGTVSVPAIRIRNATNTGIYSPSTNEMSFSVAGLSKLQVLPGRTIVRNDLACGSYRETITNIGNSGTSKTLAVGGVQVCTLTGNCTFAMPGTEASHSGRGITLRLNTGAGGFSASFTNVKWPSGVAPTVTTNASRIDIFCFISDGTNWYGSAVQNYV